MTRDEGVALIKQHLAFKTTLDAEIVTNMKLAQTTLERSPTKPWFLESDPTSLVTVADTQLVTLPSGFICEMEDHPLLLTDEDGYQQELKKDDFRTLQRQYREAEADQPWKYALLNESIALFPTPDAAYNLSWRFYEADDTLDTDIENAWLREVPLLLLGSAGQLIAGGPIRDKAAMEIFGAWIATGLQLVAKHNSLREVAGRQMQMGGPHN